jgi:RES domain-containing protein
MLVYRIQRAEYAQTREDILSGIGAKLYGGRWNPKGVPLVYTSATPELAHSEFTIHLESLLLPSSHYIILQVPDESILEVKVETLPKNWRNQANMHLTQQFTKEWLKEKKHLALGVPSSIVPMSYNYLINPLHPDIKKVEIIKSELFIFDERFLFETKDTMLPSMFEEMLKAKKE